MVTISGMTAGTNGVTMNMDWSTNNGSTYLNSNFQCGLNTNTYNSATYANQNTTTTAQITNAGNISSTANTKIILWLQDFAVSGFPSYNGTLYANQNQGGILFGAQNTAVTVNNIKFSMSSGNIATGTFSLYGIAK